MQIYNFAKFMLGQVVYHREMNYRGVVVDVDPVFLGGGEIAAEAVGEDEPLDAPWYHVLVNGRDHVTYVSENSLSADDTGAPIKHRSLTLYFSGYKDDHYVPRRCAN